MSISNDIRKLLDIQDQNIYFEENCVHEGTFKGKPCKFVNARLTYEPTCCPKCDAPKEGASIYKNGHQKSRITLPMAGTCATYLVLNKQRFMCRACQRSFTAKTSIVTSHAFITNTVKAQVLMKAVEAQSITAIASDCQVSHATVQRVINEEAKRFKQQNKKLPQHLSFDEFKYAKNRMAFEYINVETGELLDILEARTARAIKDHFLTHYQLKDRRRVETVTIDMNAGYVSVIQALFPNAKIIIDRFHLVQLISRAMNKTRIQVMNRFKTSNNEDMKKYRRLKAYWKLLLKKASDVSITTYKYYRLFGQRLESAIIDELLNYDDTLRVNYVLYQNLLRAMDQQDHQALEQLLTQPCPQATSTHLRTSMKTLRKHLPYIQHSFDYTYSNGRIEGMNNKIKVLNRVAYGYRNFTNYKNRILLYFKLKPVSSSVSKQKKTRFIAA